MKSVVNFIKNRKNLIVMIAIIAIVSLAVGTTFSLLMIKSNDGNPVTNSFVATNGGVKVLEDYDGETKKNVNAQNTSDYHAYLRIQLISYRIDKEGNRIGGESVVPAFTPGTGWLSAGNDIYIYSKPVAPASKPANDLIGSIGIKLVEYTDVDGGVQQIDVVAEAIQSSPADAVTSAWNVTVDKDGVLSLKGE